MPSTDMYAGIYVKNVPKTANLFRKALGAKARSLQPNMIELRVGSGRLLLNERDMSPKDSTATEPAKELELGVWVEDVDEVYDKVTDMVEDETTPPISYISEVEEKQSGIKDFRFKLADGYYVRVTGDA